ncbi:sulfotransferase family protein [Waterburya agarophytonicola K14]|uniref:Sulfotransferase family protein n=1 Tax=Waterburya agarophytonicola KI4 TaxID=2874699 RepID=A0A964FHI2_9CYAN|nr:sulfotransferase family protein [Waterburya agarophytonicola]MCC0177659.1 sulfotransferase family protein [Waterburya agarophytonicola KI4]
MPILKTTQINAITGLLQLNDSGSKAPAYLANNFAKEGKIGQAINYYAVAAKAIADKAIFKTKPGWLEEPWAEKAYIANHKYKFVYCPIPKVACSSFKRFAVELSDLENKQEVLNLPPKLFHAYVDHNLSFFANYLHQRETAMALLDNPDYFKFAIVRNPWDRLTSAYLNKFVKPIDIKQSSSPGKQVVEAYYQDKDLPVDYSRGITFKEFIEYLLTHQNKEIDGHWQPQSMFINQNKFDYLGRIETLGTDFGAIAEKIGVEANLGWANRSKRAEVKENILTEDYAGYTPHQLRQLSQYPAYTEFYTPELLALVKQRYTEDVESFGYRFGA